MSAEHQTHSTGQRHLDFRTLYIGANFELELQVELLFTSVLFFLSLSFFSYFKGKEGVLNKIMKQIWGKLLRNCEKAPYVGLP